MYMPFCEQLLSACTLSNAQVPSLFPLSQEVELQMLTKYGSVEQVRYLLTTGVDVNMAGSVSDLPDI